MIGIVASRLVERYRRPIVLIAGTDGDWKGSGRSISGFDLHGALGSCSAHLERFGGHRAAAGLSIRPESVGDFATAFAAHADAVLTDADLAPPLVVDAVVPARGCTLELADELRRLAPFGLGNPGVTLLVAGCELTDLQTVGEGKHLRFRAADEGGTRGARSRSASGRSSTAGGGRAPTTSPSASSRTHGTGRPSRSSSSGGSSTRPSGTGRFARSSPPSGGRGRRRGATPARAVFEELELEEGAWRSLLESEAFRALLEPEPRELAEAA